MQNTHPPPIIDALRDLVPFVQFKKREKQPWRSVTPRFLNCTNGTKSRETTHICIGNTFGNNFHLLEKHRLKIRQKSIMK